MRSAVRNLSNVKTSEKQKGYRVQSDADLYNLPT